MTSRDAVLLAQLGGPERREELEPFLYELFADPEVLRIRPASLRRYVARTIARRRAPSSAAIYERIGWSPIRRLTEEQRALLETELARRAAAAGRGVPAVHAAMVCSEPRMEGAVARIADAKIERVLLLPLYPQYSFTTTRSAETRLREALGDRGRGIVVDTVASWYDEPGFLDAHAARIREALERLPEPDPSKVHVLYSAHSLPRRLVEKHGDPYQAQIEKTVALVNERLGGAFRSSLAYQSKVGPVAWIGPSTQDEIARLAREGVRQVLCVPIAFVTEHVETLYEIAILFADVARLAGIERFVPVGALNGHPDLVRALADVVERRLAR
ncbi:MAG: ferrochelatase [Acidobacteriota bacterium]